LGVNPYAQQRTKDAERKERICLCFAQHWKRLLPNQLLCSVSLEYLKRGGVWLIEDLKHAETAFFVFRISDE